MTAEKLTPHPRVQTGKDLEYLSNSDCLIPYEETESLDNEAYTPDGIEFTPGTSHVTQAKRGPG